MIKPFEHHQINNRILTTFSPLQNELINLPNKNILFDLSYLTCLDVIGETSNEFLQGQLSCDVRNVSLQQMQQGALCNLKGRVLALLDVINWRGFRLILPLDLLSETQASLTKTALFSRVKLEHTTQYQLFGFHFRNHDDMIPFNATLPKERLHAIHNDSHYSYHLGHGFYIFLIEKKIAATIAEPFIRQQQWRGSLAWHALQLQQHRIEIYPQSRGLFLPHRLGLHLSDYISFDKGCYKGQEIIARMHYRAKLKHRLKLFTIRFNGPLQSGQVLLDSEQRSEMGELIDFCPIGEGVFLIVVSMIDNHPRQVYFAGQKTVIELEE